MWENAYNPEWYDFLFFNYFNSIEEARAWLDPDDASEDDIEQKYYQENDRFHEWEKWRDLWLSSTHTGEK